MSILSHTDEKLMVRITSLQFCTARCSMISICDGRCLYSKSKIAIFFKIEKKSKSRFHAYLSPSDRGKYSMIMCDQKHEWLRPHYAIGRCTN